MMLKKYLKMKRKLKKKKKTDKILKIFKEILDFNKEIQKQRD